MNIKKEIIKILENHTQTLDGNGLGWELNAIGEDDIDEVAEDIVKKLALCSVVKRSCECNAPRYIEKGDVLRCTKCKKAHLLC